MSDIFISYARSTEREAKAIAEALRALGYGVWRDDELPAHKAYAEVISERLASSKAVVVMRRSSAPWRSTLIWPRPARSRRGGCRGPAGRKRRRPKSQPPCGWIRSPTK